MNKSEFFIRLEQHFSDLDPILRSKLVQKADEMIQRNENLLLQPPMSLANQLRIEAGKPAFIVKKKFSFFRFFLKAFSLMFFLSILGISILAWKYTPLLKIDDEKQRIIILGGLVDIDAKAGKFKVLDQYHFSQSHYKNEFQGDVALSTERDEVIINFNSGAFNLKPSESEFFQFDCKVEKVPKKNIIKQEDDMVELDFTQMEGVNCEFKVPEDKKVTITGDHAKINLTEPRYDAYIELKNGNVSISPAPETGYNYDLKVENGYQGDFTPSTASDSYEIKVELENGSISNH